MIGLKHRNVVYVKLKRKEISVKHIASGRTLSIPTTVYHDWRNGGFFTSDAKPPKGDFVEIEPFGHPRVIIVEFPYANELLRHCLHQVLRRVLWRPGIIIQVVEPLEGGLTEIETRALRWWATLAGGKFAYVWDGPELTDDQIATRRFPGDYWLFEKPKWARLEA